MAPGSVAEERTTLERGRNEHQLLPAPLAASERPPAECASGATEIARRPAPDGGVAHALLTIGGEMIMIEMEWPTRPSRAPAQDGSSPVVIFLYVEDVDATVDRGSEGGRDNVRVSGLPRRR